MTTSPAGDEPMSDVPYIAELYLLLLADGWTPPHMARQRDYPSRSALKAADQAAMEANKGSLKRAVSAASLGKDYLDLSAVRAAIVGRSDTTGDHPYAPTKDTEFGTCRCGKQWNDPAHVGRSDTTGGEK